MKPWLQRKVIIGGLGLAFLTLLSFVWNRYIQSGFFLTIELSAFQYRTVSLIALVGYSLNFGLLCFMYYLLNRQIIERQQVKQALRESEQRFRSAFENAAIGMSLVSPDGRWLRVNRSLCEIVGYSESELLATTFQAITHPDDLDTDLDYVRQMLRDEIRYYEMEKRYLHKQGHIVWILLSGSLVRDSDGQPLYFIAQIQDITRRKQVEEALRESEERWQLALRGNNDGIWDWNVKTNEVFFSSRWKEMLGYEDNEISNHLDEWAKRVHPDDLPWVSQVIQDHFAKRTPFYISEHRVLCKDGTYKWILDRGQALWDEAGNAVRMAGSHTDITERKQAEQALRESERRFRAIFDQTFQFVGLLKPDGTLLEANQTALDFGGITHADTVGLPFWEARWWTISTETQNQLKDAIARAARGEFVRYEVDVLGAKDTVATIDFSLKPFLDETGEIVLLIPEGRDISQRKRVEDALRQSEALFRSLSESSPVGIFRTDARGNCIYTNPRCQAICGFTYGEALGEGWKPFVHPKDLEPFLSDWAKAAVAKKEFFTDIRCCHRDGTIRFCRFQAVPILSTEQQLSGYVGTVEDITDARAIEKMKNEFISIVSHELRTPLASIQGSLGLLTSGRLNSQPEKVQRMLEIAKAETERLTRLVSDILDLERLESGKIAIEKNLCDTATIMLQSVESVRTLAEKSQIGLKVSPLSVQVWADSDRIIQTLVNLLSNSIKFSPPGSTVWLSAELSQNPSLNTPQVLFKVQDWGRGIPSDKLDSIFRRFQQVDATDSRTKGGTGLGLAICRSIVQQHGGQIWAESVLGQGSIFYFTLPLPPKSK
ncbi:hypothetical protein NUACC21_75460 [Scytonema sp. NUACC21]